MLIGFKVYVDGDPFVIENAQHAAGSVWAETLICGTNVVGTRRLAVLNPADPKEEVGSIPLASVQDVSDAVAGAKVSQREWQQRSFVERASLISSSLDSLEDDVEASATLYSRENGKTLTEARTELNDVPKRAQFTLARAKELDELRSLPSSNGSTFVRSLPYGVVAAIAPWNAPVSLACMQIVPALLCGNSVIVKPPESCPLTLTNLLHSIAGKLPPGVIQIVTGLPSEIGDALTRHPDISKISFVGGIPSARGILCNAAETVKSVTVELGGNDAAIVLDDADLQRETLRRMAGSVFRMAGQVCMAIKRIYVPNAIYDQFADSFRAVVDEIVVGPGTAPGVTMGPLHTSAAAERARAIQTDAHHRGATVQELGRISERAKWQSGYFIRPTVITEVDDEARVVAEEQFCPVIPLLRYTDVDDALHRANETSFGLGGSVWSRDTDRARNIAMELQAGTVFVNTHGTNSVNRQAPYGGVKQSGGGRRGGLEGILEYAQSQTITTFC